MRITAEHVFISYMREDAERVKWLQDRLRNEGVAVWRDRSNLWPGQDWKIEIRRAITGGLAFIACFSEHTQRRDVSFFWEELNWALEEVRKRQHRTLDSLQWTSLFGRKRDKDAAFAQLLVAIRTLRTAPEPAMAPPPRQPQSRQPQSRQPQSRQPQSRQPQPSASTGPAFSDPDLYKIWGKPPEPGSSRSADSASRPKVNNQPQSPGGANFSLGDLDLDKISIPAFDALFGADRSVRLKGRGPSSRTVKVHIPRGVREGQLIKVVGEGSPGQGGGSPGDLYLQVRIKPLPK